MAIQTHFTKFHNKIKLTRESDEYSDAREKDSSIMIEVRKAFREEGYPVAEDFYQGSFSTHTAIRSLDGDFDIDHAVAIDSEKAPEAPVSPKKTVKKVLDARGFKNSKIKKPCITADYSSLDLHIDIPVYSKSGSTYSLAVGKENSGEAHREWADSDPKGLRDWINETKDYADSPNDTQQQFIRIVRYIKRWRDFKFSSDVRRKVFSIGLTVMVKECFQPYFDEDGKPDDLQAFKATVDEIFNKSYFTWTDTDTDKYRVSVYLPVTPTDRDIFDGSSIDTGTQLYNKLRTLQTKLGDAGSEGNEDKQCEILNKLFGDDFKVPEKASKASNSNGRLAAFSSAGVVGTSQGA